MENQKRPTMKEIAEACDCTIDNVFRIKRLGHRPSLELAKKLEVYLGIPRLYFLYPGEEFPSPWKIFYDQYK